MATRVEVVLGDITRCDADVIVNAANETLLGGGGVDGAIHDAAGLELLRECKSIGGCPTGEVRVTGAHNLPFQAIIHTVGPIWRGGHQGERDLLRACYEKALAACAGLSAKRIAFPSISTGAFGFPEKLAAEIAVATCLSWDGLTPDVAVLTAIDHQAKSVLDEALAATT